MLVPFDTTAATTGGYMAKRFGVSKRSSAGHFKSQVSRTKSPNINRQVMRGGWRL